MEKSKKKAPEFFDSAGRDPVKAATGFSKDASFGQKKVGGPEKKKAGFYIGSDLLERFDKVFYRLKLEGVDVANKSMLLEAALRFALDDIDKGKKSLVRKMLSGR